MTLRAVLIVAVATVATDPSGSAFGAELQRTETRNEAAPHKWHFHYHDNDEAKRNIVAEMEKEDPPQGSPRRKVLDDFENLQRMGNSIHRHDSALKQEMEHIETLREHAQDSMRRDEPIIAEATKSIHKAEEAADSVADTWPDESGIGYAHTKRAVDKQEKSADELPASIKAADDGPRGPQHVPQSALEKDNDSDELPQSIMDEDDPSSLIEEEPEPDPDSDEADIEKKDKELKVEMKMLKERLVADGKDHPLSGPRLEPDGTLDIAVLEKNHLEALEEPLPEGVRPKIYFLNYKKKERDPPTSFEEEDGDPTAGLSERRSEMGGHDAADFRRRRLPMKFARGKETKGKETKEQKKFAEFSGDRRAYRMRLQNIADKLEANLTKLRATSERKREENLVQSRSFDPVNHASEHRREHLRQATNTLKREQKQERRRRSPMKSAVPSAQTIIDGIRTNLTTDY